MSVDRLARFAGVYAIIRAIEDPNPERDAGLTGDLEKGVDEIVAPFLDDLVTWTKGIRLDTPWMIEVALVWLRQGLDAMLAIYIHGESPEDIPHEVGLPIWFLEERLGELIRAPGPRIFFRGKEYPEHGDITYWPLDVFPEDPESGECYGLDFDYNPGTETKKKNEERAVAQFLHFYRAAQDRRLAEAQERYPTRTRPRLYDHFVWLVQFQVLEWSYSKVAREAHRARSTVTEAIRDTAALIGLKRRDEA